MNMDLLIDKIDLERKFRKENIMETITINEAMTLIDETNGKTFSARFVKKDGSIRDMNCRLGVKKYLAGGKLAFDARERQLIPVFDMQKKAYRMINAKTLIEIKANGKVYKIS